MAQPLEVLPELADDELSLSANRIVLINHLYNAEAAFAQAQADTTARLGEKATAAVMLQEAHIRLAAYNDFHAQ